jgi:P4 family phage/plasmid primase-like protien
MDGSTKSPNLHSFLSSHKYEKGKNELTHTRIGDPTKKIYGGSYSIPLQDIEEFNELYYHHVFHDKQKEYLTEKQLSKGGPLLIDIDLRYDESVQTRQHTENHIIDLLQVYLDELKELLIFEPVNFPIYIFEKPTVNKDTNNNITKDGIHIIFGIKLDHNVQEVLRKRIIDSVGDIWDDLPLLNAWESILDEGISVGYTNWQLLGSRKPKYKVYVLQKIYTCVYNVDSYEFELSETDIGDVSLKELFPSLCARYTDHVHFPLKDGVTIPKKKLKVKTSVPGNECIRPMEITNLEDLDIAVALFLKNSVKDDGDGVENNEIMVSSTSNYNLKEIHQYTMILPEAFYGPGSYTKWMKVGWALRHTHNNMLLTWLKFSSQSSEFKYEDIPKLCEQWKYMYDVERPVTSKSIFYWAREYGNSDELDKIEEESVNYYVQATISDASRPATEYDLANVLFNMYKGKYICVSIKLNIWYEYKQHRWHEIDSGNSLRSKISTAMHKKYFWKIWELTQKWQQLEGDEYEKMEKYVRFVATTADRLKRTIDKDKIMKEAKELFYDDRFLDDQDSKPYLLGFTNGVYDFEEKHFRDGRPDDYIVKCTNYDYVPKHQINQSVFDEVTLFMEQLFPVEELRRYMWDHLASTLIGTNENQTFNIYTGSGRNGKSMLVLLMGKVLGDYKGTVPITLITQKRTSIGGTSSEIVALKGTRYAVMQEPSKGDKINEGIMKEITGGDPIQGRALFRDTVTFIPQFKLVVCTNTLFDIEADDDGTWRRIRVCDHMAKFMENPVDNDPDEPYQFKVNKRLEDKFAVWKTAFMALLVELALVNKGDVKDCEIVLAQSNKYREGQNYLSEFMKDRIEQNISGILKKREVAQEFKDWYTEQYGKTRIMPKSKEIINYIIKKHGKYPTGGWKGISIICDEDDE